MTVKKELRRQRIRYRVRAKIKGSPARPRLSVFRSNRFIYAQIIDDLKGHTLCSADSREEAVAKDVPKRDQARQVGKILAERAKAANVETIVFDRNGYLYHGRVQALAEGAREGGLIF